MRFRLTLLALILLVLPCTTMAERQSLTAVRTTHPPLLDGVLDDACWKDASRVNEFYFIADGSMAGEPTQAWVCYDDKAVYVAFDCTDSQPEKITAEQTKRGGRMGMDDRVEIDIDCYGNANSGQIAWFQVTPRGTQRESLPSGDATNIKWKGDWTAVAKRMDSGYTVELKVPFSILQYDAKHPSMAVMLARYHSRTGKWWIAPNLGPNGEPRFYYAWNGVQPPQMVNRPMVMLSSVVSGGSGSDSGDLGLDVKYALTPDLTAVATANPDFRNVEQDVGTTDYTYTEQYIADARPFFQQGSAYLPGSDMLYTTKRVTDVDYAGKLVGSYGGCNVGFIHVAEGDSANATALKISRDLSGLGQLSVSEVISDASGDELGATQMSGSYLVYTRGRQRLNVSSSYGTADVSTSSGKVTPETYSFGASYGGGTGSWTWGLSRRVVDPLYQPALAIEQENDLQAWSLSGSLYNEPTAGDVKNWSVGWNVNTTDHTDGSKYYDAVSASADCTWRGGTYGSVGVGLSNRIANGTTTEYRDRTGSLYYSWDGHSLYRSGGVGVTFGRVADGDYLSYSVSQGHELSRRLSVSMSYQHTKLCRPSPSAYEAGQWITRFTYDLDDENVISGRMLQTSGHTNVYLAYRRRVRRGTDIYVILGDPNANSTESRFSVKLVRPM